MNPYSRCFGGSMLVKKNILILFFICLLIPGLISLYLGQDINADLCNYHFYDGYALLNLKLKHDFFPGDFMGYLNPTLDSLNYLMITYLPSLLTGFLIGAIQGLNFFLVLLLSYLYLKYLEPSYQYQMIIVTMIVLLSLI